MKESMVVPIGGRWTRVDYEASAGVNDDAVLGKQNAINKYI